MSTYKTALLLCSDDSQKLITELVNSQSIKYIFTDNISDFEKEIKNSPDTILICASFINDNFAKRFSKLLMIIPTAVIVCPEQMQQAGLMMEHGVNTFISTNNLKKGLYSFFELILKSDPKADVLVKALRKLRRMADKTNDSLIILNEDKIVSYINQSALDMMNMDRKDVLNKKTDEIFEQHLFQVENQCRDVLTFDEFDFKTSSGHTFKATGTYSPIFEKGDCTGAVIILNKLTGEQENKQREFELMKYQQRYHSTQQNIAFKKQMLILKDEMSNIKTSTFSVETYFKPLDILSGDSYGSINLKDGRYLFYIIDAMGKGLSASVTALQSTSFINHSVEFSLLKDDFELDKTLTSFLYYIRDRLMDEEALCCAFALLDAENETLTVANYGLPPVYITDTEGNIEIYRPNNLPVMRCVTTKNTTVIPLENADKILMLSDGLVESETKDGGLYTELIQDHLKQAFTKKHFLALVYNEILENEDDITFFFLRRDAKIVDNGVEFTINTSLKSMFELNEKLGQRMLADGVPEADCNTIEYAVSEIVMNAFEHGNLKIDFKKKQNLIATGEYDDYIKAQSAPDSENYNKQITLKYKFVKPEKGKPGAVYINVTDSGQGFSPANLFKYHTFDGNMCHIDIHSYNGRGIFISDNLLDGLYYNETGNCASMVKMIEWKESEA